MALKYTVSDLNEVGEAVRPFYVKREDGSFVLDADGATDKSKLNEFRQTNVDLMKKMEAFKDLDPKKYAELMETDRKVREKQLIEAGKVDEVIAERVQLMRSQYDREVQTRDEQLKVANRQLETLLIDNAVKSSAVTHGILSTAIDDIVLRAKTAFSIQDGRPVMKNEKGEVVYGEDGTSPVSIDSWTKQLKNTAPHLFAGFTGSGAPGARGGGPGMKPNMTPVEKIAAGLNAGLAPRMGGPIGP
jgi:hypothetical protein